MDFLNREEEKNTGSLHEQFIKYFGKNYYNIDKLRFFLKKHKFFIKNNRLSHLQAVLSLEDLGVSYESCSVSLPVEISVYYCDLIQELTRIIVKSGSGTNQSIQHHIIRDFFGVGHRIREQYPFVEFEKRIGPRRFDLIFYKESPSKGPVRRTDQYRVEVKTIATIHPIKKVVEYYFNYLEKVDRTGYPLYDALWSFLFLSNENLDKKTSLFQHGMISPPSPGRSYCGQYL